MLCVRYVSSVKFVREEEIKGEEQEDDEEEENMKWEELDFLLSAFYKLFAFFSSIILTGSEEFLFKAGSLAVRKVLARCPRVLARFPEVFGGSGKDRRKLWEVCEDKNPELYT